MSLLEGVVPFPPEFVASYRAKGYWEDRSMANFFDELVAKYAHRVAFVADGEQITYRQLAHAVERLALHLLRLGVEPLDRFVLQLPNSIKFVYCYLTLQLGSSSSVLCLTSGCNFCPPVLMTRTEERSYSCICGSLIQRMSMAGTSSMWVIRSRAMSGHASTWRVEAEITARAPCSIKP